MNFESPASALRAGFKHLPAAFLGGALFVFGSVLVVAFLLASVIMTWVALDTLGLLTAMGISYTAWGLIGLVAAFLVFKWWAAGGILLWVYLSESVHLPETMTTELWIALVLLLSVLLSGGGVNMSSSRSNNR